MSSYSLLFNHLSYFLMNKKKFELKAHGKGAVNVRPNTGAL